MSEIAISDKIESEIIKKVQESLLRLYPDALRLERIQLIVQVSAVVSTLFLSSKHCPRKHFVIVAVYVKIPVLNVLFNPSLTKLEGPKQNIVQ